MHVSYQLTVSATCPVDHAVRDDYTVVIEAEEMIKIESLLALMEEYRPKVMFQEDLTRDIAQQIATATKVTTAGTHSGVKTVCICATLSP
jgi:NADPH-dependent 7-cyano-7-deazaguanine reductase QueF